MVGQRSQVREAKSVGCRGLFKLRGSDVVSVLRDGCEHSWRDFHCCGACVRARCGAKNDDGVVRMRKRRHTVTEIVGAVYCEQKVIFDKRYGRSKTKEVAEKAAGGTFEHLRFEMEGYTRNPLRLLAKMGEEKPRYRRPKDDRCFVATMAYGGDSAEANHLRAWRDRVLIQSKAGRGAVWCYYKLSPGLVWAAERSPAIKKIALMLVNGALKKTGWRE